MEQLQTLSHCEVFDRHNSSGRYLISVEKLWWKSIRQVFEDCGFLQNLLPGDVVLADRSFNISESVGLLFAENIPAFSKGLELETARKIAQVRIHVERVIGLIRNKYTILRSQLPINYLLIQFENTPVIGKITVCCSLTNLCALVVPSDWELLSLFTGTVCSTRCFCLLVHVYVFTTNLILAVMI